MKQSTAKLIRAFKKNNEINLRRNSRQELAKFNKARRQYSGSKKVRDFMKKHFDK